MRTASTLPRAETLPGSKPLGNLAEDLDSVSTRFLGAEHGRIGLSKQRFGVRGGVGKRRNADAARDVNLRLADRKRHFERAQDPLSDGGNVERVIYLFEDDRELVAAEAGHGFAIASDAAQKLRHGLEHAVAGLVTKGIVDLLESIQVDEHEGRTLAGAARLREGMVQPIMEQRAVDETGERIEVRALVQNALENLALDRI